MRSHAPILALALAALVGGPAFAVRTLYAEDPAPAPAPATDPDETRGYVGYSPAIAQMLTEEQRKEFHVTKDVGVIVTAVLPGGPGEKAGLQVGDLLVTINGQAVPDTSKIGPKDEAAARAYMDDTLRGITHKVKPGDTVEIVVERAGKSITLKPVAIDKTASDALREAAHEESDAVKVPEPKGFGTPTATTIDFETIPAGENVPAGFLQVKGVWEVTAEEGKPANHAIQQEGDWGDGFAFGVLTGDGHLYENGSASVRLAMLSGESSVSGGLVFRAQSWKSYYVARVDGVAKNLRIYVAKDRKLVPLATVDLASPKLGSWHTLEVSWNGPQLKATFDGKVTVEAKDATYATGWAGLAVQGDAKTMFDDWKLTPAPGASK